LDSEGILSRSYSDLFSHPIDLLTSTLPHSRNFFPVVLAALKKLPIIGSILNAPVISTLADKLAGRSTILPLYDRD